MKTRKICGICPTCEYQVCRCKEMKTYQIGLTKKGKEMFEGGNIDVMKHNLIKFKAENSKQALKEFEKICTERGMFSQDYMYLEVSF